MGSLEVVFSAFRVKDFTRREAIRRDDSSQWALRYDTELSAVPRQAVDYPLAAHSGSACPTKKRLLGQHVSRERLKSLSRAKRSRCYGAVPTAPPAAENGDSVRAHMPTRRATRLNHHELARHAKRNLTPITPSILHLTQLCWIRVASGSDEYSYARLFGTISCCIC